jgi:N-sulfoglucosamine sulfohydrolase
MKIFTTISALLLTGLTLLAAGSKPNIVVFLCDDLGFLDSTPYGATDVRTPNMQRLVIEGLAFNRAFVASPACCPSRAAMLSGLMPSRNGAEANHTFAKPGTLGWPHYLRELGYDTAAFGKVAHGEDGKRWDFNHCELEFDLNLVRSYVTNRTGDKPLCLFVGTHDPHVPWTKNTEYDPAKLKLPWNFVDTPETRNFRANYYTEVTRADTDMGALYDFIRQKLGTNTLFMFSSDHGAQWPFGKWNLYDTSIRTPLLAAWSGVIKPGTRTDAMVSWVDFAPTLIELAGGTPPSSLDGRSFAAVLLGKSTTHREEIFTTHSGDGKMNVYPIRALRTAQFKYIKNLYPEYEYTTHIDRARPLSYWPSWVAAAKTNEAAAAIVRWYHERPAEELFDIIRDPDEKYNLAADSAYAATLKEMRGKLEAWMKSQNDSQKMFNTPYDKGTPELELLRRNPAGQTRVKEPSAGNDD